VRPAIVESHDRIGPIAEEWDRLADEKHAPPWARPGWHAAWWNAFGRGRLEIHALRRGGRLAAVLPLQRAGGELRSTSNYHTPAYGLLAEDRDAVGVLTGRLFRDRARRIVLSFLWVDEAGLGASQDEAQRADRRLLVRTVKRSPFVDTSGDWATYEHERRGHLLRELRRRRRRLQDRGRVEFEVREGRDGLDDLLEEGFAVERSGWKGARGTAIASRPETRRFYADVARLAVQRGSLRLAFLRLDGRPLAFDFAIEEGGVHHLLKTGFDEAFHALAPGMLLRQDMIRRAFECRLERYEFLGPDVPWKLEWATGTREQILVQAFAPSVPGLLDWAAFAYGRPLAKRLLRRPA
jgi:CelD/BcsL family acetyltransferase involved in cellulose biosynthesis